ncbi:hypothetical protein ACFLYL_03330, partial [Chloroflexota bacterium]
MLFVLRIKDRLFYGWVIVVAFLIFGAISYGTRYSFGVFFKSLQGQFDLTRTATSSIFSAYALFSIVFSIFCGWASDKY